MVKGREGRQIKMLLCFCIACASGYLVWCFLLLVLPCVDGRVDEWAALLVLVVNLTLEMACVGGRVSYACALPMAMASTCCRARSLSELDECPCGMCDPGKGLTLSNCVERLRMCCYMMP